MNQTVPYRDLFNSDPQDTLARLKLLYSNATGGFVVTLLCMLVVCFAFDTPDSQAAKNILFVVYLLSHSVRVADNLYTRRCFRLGTIETKAIVRRFTLGIILNSSIWAVYSILFVAQMETAEITVSAIIISALAGGTITILAATTLLSMFYMSCLLIPFVIAGLFSSFEYFYYISFLGFIFWLVMLASAVQAGKFLSEVLLLKNENVKVQNLMDAEQQEVFRVNEALTAANSKLDRYANRLESEVEKRTQELFKLANIDPLTNLNNRTAFSKTIKQILAQAKKNNEQYLLLFIDLNGFKDVNDGFGHKIGDTVLTEVAKRLESLRGLISEDSDTVESDSQANLLCRWGGDEFLFLSKFKTQECIDTLVNAIEQHIKEPIKIASNNISLGASIGIAKYPADSLRANDLIQYADISMYHHKKYGLGKAVYFSLTLLDEFQRDQIIRDGLKNALQKNEFSLVFHPIIDTQTNRPWALEALIRWQHKGKSISPVEFIPIAEKSGHIIQIGRWVLFTACHAAMQWKTEKLPAVSVNVSSLQLLDKHFVEVLKLVLQESGLPADRLHLEITESVMLEKGDIAATQLKQIAEMGIHISIDDFGTGYSSLKQLQSMAFDIIKIDRSFLQDLNKKDMTIIAATKLIADEFEAITVAEGIETEKELSVLNGIGIRYIQGFLFAKPMATEKVNLWLSENELSKNPQD